LSADKEVQQRKRTRANSEGGMFHDKARGRWVGSYTAGYRDDGRQVRKYVTGKTKAEALTRLQEAQQAAAQGMDPASRTLTVAKYLQGWLDDVVPGSVAPSTAALYRDIVRLYITPYIGQKRLVTLTARDVSRMLLDLERGDPDATPPRASVSPNTRRNARSVLRRALRYAMAEGMVARNVAALADGVKVGAPEGRTMTPDQARTLLDSLKGHRMEAAFVVALSLGLRRGELLGLTWDEITMDTTPPRLTVRRQLRRLPRGGGLELSDLKTSSSRRTVHLPAPAVAVLRDHRKRQLEERLAAGPEWVDRPLGADLVFRTPFGTPMDPDNFRHITYNVTTNAGVKYNEDGEPIPGTGIGQWSPHELRHSAASLLMAQGVEMKQISELLGHSSIRVTADIYAHMLDAGKSTVADAMSAALWGNA